MAPVTHYQYDDLQRARRLVGTTGCREPDVGGRGAHRLATGPNGLPELLHQCCQGKHDWFLWPRVQFAGCPAGLAGGCLSCCGT